jgi:hypothetical protein
MVGRRRLHTVLSNAATATSHDECIAVVATLRRD